MQHGWLLQVMPLTQDCRFPVDCQVEGRCRHRKIGVAEHRCAGWAAALRALLQRQRCMPLAIQVLHAGDARRRGRAGHTQRATSVVAPARSCGTLLRRQRCSGLLRHHARSRRHGLLAKELRDLIQPPLLAQLLQQRAQGVRAANASQLLPQPRVCRISAAQGSPGQHRESLGNWATCSPVVSAGARKRRADGRSMPRRLPPTWPWLAGRDTSSALKTLTRYSKLQPVVHLAWWMARLAPAWRNTSALQYKATSRPAATIAGSLCRITLTEFTALPAAPGWHRVSSARHLLPSSTTPA